MHAPTLFPSILPQLEGELAWLDAEIATRQAARAEAEARATAAQQALDAAAAARSEVSGRRDRMAAAAAALADQLAAADAALAGAQAALDQATQAVAAHDAVEPMPPEPDEEGHITLGDREIYRKELARWREEHEPIVAARQAAAAALTAAAAARAEAAARLSSSQTTLAQVTAELTSATTAEAGAQTARDAEAGSLAADDARLAALADDRQQRAKRRSEYAQIAAVVMAEPFDRRELEATAQELARRLWELRRQRAGLLAARQGAIDDRTATEGNRAAAWTEFDALRVELDSEFGLHTGNVGPDACVAALAQAITTAQAVADEAAKRLTETARKVAKHGEA
jgi:hypothetical protein